VSEPTAPSDLLDDYRVPAAGNLYVLGSFDQRVTFYSQQIRALNLVDVLVRAGVLGEGSKLLIVGAGLAGLTAAAAAARVGVQVRVLEKQGDLLPTFRGCHQRFIHPRIYDWPEPGWNDSRARLPLLDWTAAPAANVAIQVIAGFERIQADVGERALRVTHKVREIHPRLHDGARYRTTWAPGGGQFESDAVILAVGFGVERVDNDFPPVNRYWDDDALIGYRDGECTWFVSGCGDGGLIDVIRLRLRDFRHETFLEELLRDLPELGPIERRLLEIECDPALTADRFRLTEAYLELSTPELDRRLRKRLRDDRRVILNATEPGPISRKASMLNRFLVSRFLDRDDALAIDYVPGRATFHPDRQLPRGAVVRIDGYDDIRADRVVLRQGPEKAFKKSFPELYNVAEAPLTTAAHTGRARRPAWDPGRFGPEVVPGDPDARDQNSAAERAYLEQLRDEFSLLDLQGLSGTGKQIVLPLDRVYVELRSEPDTATERIADRGLLEIDVKERLRHHPGDVNNAWTDELLRDPYFLRAWHRRRDTQGRPVGGDSDSVPLARVVQLHSRLVLLGDPGSGKTTLLRYLALRHAHARLAGDARATGATATDAGVEDLGPTRLPIYVRIAAYAEARRKAVIKPEMLEFLATTATRPQSRVGVDELRALFAAALDRGDALVLLDGLDEVPVVTERQQIAQEIEAWIVETAPDTRVGNQVLCTSRIAGYRAAPLRERIAHQVIQDLSDHTISAFLHRWCRAVEDQLTVDSSLPEAARAERAAATERALQAELAHPRVRRLAVNPLMLTLLALLQRTERGLPRHRVELYRYAVRTLLETWRRTSLTEEQVLHLLGPIAAWLHKHRPLGLLTEEELRRQIFEGLCKWEGDAPDSAPAKLEQSTAAFIEAVRRESGILLARGEQLYGFVHLSFQEYFVARYIARQTATLYAALTAHAADSRWHEPLILAIGHVSREMPGEVQQVFERLLNLDLPHEDLLGRSLLVGLGALAECAWVPPETVRQIVKETIQIYTFAVVAGRRKLSMRIAGLFAPLRTGLFSATIDAVLVYHINDFLTVDLIKETRWFTRATLAALLTCTTATTSAESSIPERADAALRIASDECPELFPDSLGVRSAARDHADAWQQWMAQPGLRDVLRALVRRPSLWSPRPVRDSSQTPRTDPLIITRETALDEQLRRALAAAAPRQELYDRCADVCTRRATGWEDAAALLVLGWPEPAKAIASLTPEEWRCVRQTTVADGAALASTLARLEITIADDEPEEREDHEYWGAGEHDEDEDETPEQADVNEGVPEFQRALENLKSEDDRQRDEAERVMSRQRRMSTHAHILPVLTAAEHDAFGFAGTVLASAMHNFIHDDPKVVLEWVAQTRRGDEDSKQSLASIRTVTQDVLDVVVRDLGDSAPDREDPAALPIARMLYFMLQGGSAGDLAPLALRLLRSSATEVCDATHAGLLARSLPDRRIGVSLAEHLERRATPPLLLAAALVAKALRSAQQGWTTRHSDSDPEPDPESMTVQRLERSIRGYLHHPDAVLHRAALGALLRTRPWRESEALDKIVHEFGLSERDVLLAILHALRDRKNGWLKVHTQFAAAAAERLVRSPDLLPLLFDADNRAHTREWLGVLDAVAEAAPALVSRALDTAGALPELLAATRHTHAWVCRKLAFQVLGRLRQLPRDVGEALLAGTRDINQVQKAATQAAGRMHGFDSRALDVLLGGLDSRSDRTVRATTAVLGAMATSRVLLESPADRERVVDALATACRKRNPRDGGDSLYDALFAVAASEPVSPDSPFARLLLPRPP